MRRSGGPLYLRIKGELAARLRSGDIPPNAPFPSERTLCEEFGVSNITVRRALLELVRDGLIYRQPGVGSFAAPDGRPIRLLLVVHGFGGEDWRDRGDLFVPLIDGIIGEAWRHDTVFSLARLAENTPLGSYLSSVISERTADAVLLRTLDDPSPSDVELLERNLLPYVYIKRRLADRACNCVVTDSVAAGRIMTEHLLQCGHKHIAFVGGRRGYSIGDDLELGYKSALAGAGVAVDSSLIKRHGLVSQDDGRYLMAELLKKSENRPTGVITHDDLMAVGACEAARELGLSIPQDLAVIGHDDHPVAQKHDPPLTTMRTSEVEYGRAAAELVLDLVRGERVGAQEVQVPYELIVRESCGCHANAKTVTSRP